MRYPKSFSIAENEIPAEQYLVTPMAKEFARHFWEKSRYSDDMLKRDFPGLPGMRKLYAVFRAEEDKGREGAVLLIEGILDLGRDGTPLPDALVAHAAHIQTLSPAEQLLFDQKCDEAASSIIQWDSGAEPHEK
jgi:hypothetical protein